MADNEEKIVEDTKEEVNNENETIEAEQTKEEVAKESEDKEAAPKDKKKEKKAKKEKKDKKDAQIEELTDKHVRLMAEYDNYRKRTEREKSSMFEMGAKAIVEKILPIIDNFERGFACVNDEQKDDPFVQGMDKVYKQMMDSLAEVGVTPIEAVGQEFDPNIHNAVMHVDDETVGDNVIVEEFQKGYMYRDTIVRCSMVKVAN